MISIPAASKGALLSRRRHGADEVEVHGKLCKLDLFGTGVNDRDSHCSCLCNVDAIKIVLLGSRLPRKCDTFVPVSLTLISKGLPLLVVSSWSVKVLTICLAKDDKRIVRPFVSSLPSHRSQVLPQLSQLSSLLPVVEVEA